MSTDTQPSIRWGGIVFGTLFALAAGVGLLIALDSGILAIVRDRARLIAFGIEPSTLPFVLAIGVGLLIAIVAAVALLRRPRNQHGDAGPAPSTDDVLAD